jgi:hypothetical protein
MTRAGPLEWERMLLTQQLVPRAYHMSAVNIATSGIVTDAILWVVGGVGRNDSQMLPSHGFNFGTRPRLGSAHAMSGSHFITWCLCMQAAARRTSGLARCP